MFHLLHRESKTLVGAAFLIGFLSFGSRIIGLVRDRILAGIFGAGNTLDIYYAAFKFPDLIFNLFILGALSASFIPLFCHYLKRDGVASKQAWEFTNTVLHALVILFAFISLLFSIFAQPLAAIVAPGFPEWKQVATADFLRILLLAQFFLGISMVFGSVLQGLKRFFLYSLAPIFYNIGIIFGAVVMVNWLGEKGLVWGVVFGSVLHLVIQLYGVYHAGYRYEWSLRWTKDLGEVLRLMFPRVLSLGITQINFIAMTVIGSYLTVGSLTILTFAYNIQFFPIGIIGIAYAVAAFPSLCRCVQEKNTQEFIHIFSATVRQMLFFLIPMMIVFLLLRAQIVRVVVGAGLFDWEATILTADTLAFFALSFFAQGLVFLFARAYFALHDTMTPFIAGLVSASINIIASLYFSSLMGVVGFGIAFSLSSIIQLILLWAPLRGRMGSLQEFLILRSLFIITTAGMLSALVIQLLKPISVAWFPLETFFGVLFQGLFAGGIGLFVYGFVAWYLGSPEMRDFLGVLQKKIGKKFIPSESISIDG